MHVIDETIRDYTEIIQQNNYFRLGNCNPILGVPTYRHLFIFRTKREERTSEMYKSVYIVYTVSRRIIRGGGGCKRFSFSVGKLKEHVPSHAIDLRSYVHLHNGDYKYKMEPRYNVGPYKTPPPTHITLVISGFSLKVKKKTKEGSKDMGPAKLPCYIRFLIISRSKRFQRNIKIWDRQNYLVITGFLLHIRPLYN